MLGAEMLRRTLNRTSPAHRSWLERRRRSVAVSVVVDDREVDAFVVGEPDLLPQALAPVLRHLPVGRGYLRLTGVEERRLPLGLSYRRWEAPLGSTLAALAFLDGGGGPIL